MKAFLALIIAMMVQSTANAREYSSAEICQMRVAIDQSYQPDWLWDREKETQKRLEQAVAAGKSVDELNEQRRKYREVVWPMLGQYVGGSLPPLRDCPEYRSAKL